MADLPTLCLLARTPGLTIETWPAALQALGIAAAPNATPPQPLSDAARNWLRNPDRARLEADLQACERHALQLLACTASEYPSLLATLPGAPAVLWVRGDIGALSMPQLAMVGSRNPTAAGARTAREFAHCFAASGLVITSGLALGIDAASHQGALDGGGLTVAVCGTGLDRVYPDANRKLAERIASSGALLSEFPPGTPVRRGNFPQRNRLISGLAAGTLVVEAARGSGSLITARFAAAQGREVFAIPGSIHSPLSRGCHQLLRDGAKLVEEAADVWSELRLSLTNQLLDLHSINAEHPRIGTAKLDMDYEILLDALGFGPTGIDDLVSRTGLPSDSVASMLLILELQGRVESHPGGRFGRQS